MDLTTDIEIIKGFEEDEIEPFFEILSESGYGLEYDDSKQKLSKKEFASLMDEDKRFMSLKGNIQDGGDSKLEEHLEELGIPFTRFTQPTSEDNSYLVIFDGVRRHQVACDRKGNPLVEMDKVRAVIDMLETPEEEDPYADMRALVLANEAWVETDINKFWRYGMEDSVAFSSNFTKPDDGIIDVEVEGELDGSPEVTKQING